MCDRVAHFQCFACIAASFCSEQCFMEHDDCSGGLFAAVERALDDMVYDSFEDDGLEEAGLLIEDDLLDLDDTEEASEDLIEAARAFCHAVHHGPNIGKMGLEDEDLPWLVEQELENMSEEDEELEELYGELAYHIEAGMQVPDWLREETLEVAAKTSSKKRKTKT